MPPGAHRRSGQASDADAALVHFGQWLPLSTQTNLAEENGRPTPTAFKRWALESADGQGGYQRRKGHPEYRLSDS